MTPKNENKIELEIWDTIRFLIVWGGVYLLVTLLNFGWFIAFDIDLKVMWISNTTTSLPFALVGFYRLLKSAAEEEEYGWPP